MNLENAYLNRQIITMPASFLGDAKQVHFYTYYTLIGLEKNNTLLSSGRQVTSVVCGGKW